MTRVASEDGAALQVLCAGTSTRCSCASRVVARFLEAKGTPGGWERRKEKDERTKNNIPPEYHLLFDKMKSRFKGNPDERAEQFLEFVEEHPNENAAILQAYADKELAKATREWERKQKELDRQEKELAKQKKEQEKAEQQRQKNEQKQKKDQERTEKRDNMCRKMCPSCREPLEDAPF